MASILSKPSNLLSLSRVKYHLKVPCSRAQYFSLPNKQNIHVKTDCLPAFSSLSRLIPNSTFVVRASSSDFLELIDKNEEKSLLGSKEKPAKFLFWVLLWASFSIGLYAFSGDAKAATDSIRASGFGVKVANALRTLGWPDEAVVFALAALPMIELRGAIPVGYWLQLKPVILTVLSIMGNMVPVPIIILYFKPFATFLAAKNQAAAKLLDMLFKNAKKKAGPVQEFQWLGLMLFVAVPFPGTGAWTGAFIASILAMPFWHAVSANFLGVVLAGLLVNLLVNLGLKYATIIGIVLFLISTFMWSILRYVKKSLSASI